MIIMRLTIIELYLIQVYLVYDLQTAPPTSIELDAKALPKTHVYTSA
jgi:hypothetical protein